jgi:hypothetical protein
MKDVYSTDLSIHLDVAEPEVGIRAYKNMGKRGSNWMHLTIGGFTLTVYFTSAICVDTFLESIKHSTIEDELTSQSELRRKDRVS